MGDLVRCIFCREDRPGTEEHVFPLAIGGSLVMDRVCRDCNSFLGAKIDPALTDFDPILWLRGELALAGNSKVAPSPAVGLEGIATLARDPERKVRIKYNKVSGKMDITALHHRREVDLGNGKKTIQIIVDESNRADIPKIVQRERKRHGELPFTDEELAGFLATLEVQHIDKPEVVLTPTINFAFLRHALLKIAYELAFMWLGETYIEDPLALLISDAIMKPTPGSTNGILGSAGFIPECSSFQIWIKHPSHHLAFGAQHDNKIVVAVRVFDLLEGTFTVSNHAKNYDRNLMMNRLRFIAMDAVTRNKHNSSILDEYGRMGRLGMQGQQPPFLDPLAAAEAASAE